MTVFIRGNFGGPDDSDDIGDDKDECMRRWGPRKPENKETIKLRELVSRMKWTHCRMLCGTTWCRPAVQDTVPTQRNRSVSCGTNTEPELLEKSRIIMISERRPVLKPRKNLSHVKFAGRKERGDSFGSVNEAKGA